MYLAVGCNWTEHNQQSINTLIERWEHASWISLTCYSLWVVFHGKSPSPSWGFFLSELSIIKFPLVIIASDLCSSLLFQIYPLAAAALGWITPVNFPFSVRTLQAKLAWNKMCRLDCLCSRLISLSDRYFFERGIIYLKFPENIAIYLSILCRTIFIQ